jgi:hypothetical protein
MPGTFSRFCKSVLALSLLLAGLHCARAASGPAGATKPPRDAAGDDWRPLFDGRTLAGWEQIGPGQIKLENGELVTSGGMGLLVYTREKLSNCQVRVVFKLTGTNNNTGVFIRMPDIPRDPWEAVNRGYEVQIDNSGDPWHRTGSLYSFTRVQTSVLANVGDWNLMVITLFGPRTRVHVNGVLVTDYMEGQPVPEKQRWYEGERGRRPDAGYIGLQNHDDQTRVSFREVSARKLE